MDFSELIKRAQAVTNFRQFGEMASAGEVGAALLTRAGNVYTGVCIDAACGIGFCAEHAAIAAMITAGENDIVRIVAVGHDGTILPPCGRCREFLSQLHPASKDIEVMIAAGLV